MSTLASGATVLVREDGPAVRVTLNRPDKRNALSYELMEELIAALESVGDARAVVIEATGPAFSAGHDLSEMIDRDVPFFQRLFDLCTELMELIHKLPQPVIAKVHGSAYAAGCQLVAACDLAVAADTVTFATPGVKIGLFCSTPMVPLSRAIGRKRALDMLLDRPARRCAHRARVGARQPRRRAGPARRRDHADRRGDRGLQPAHRRDRQGGVLLPDRARRAPRLRPHEGRDGDERARRRRAGGHVRLPPEAPAGVARDVAAPGGGRSRRPMASFTAVSWTG